MDWLIRSLHEKNKKKDLYENEKNWIKESNVMEIYHNIEKKKLESSLKYPSLLNIWY